MTDPSPSVDRELLAKAAYDSYRDCWGHDDLPPWEDQPFEIRLTNTCRVEAVLAEIERQGFVLIWIEPAVDDALAAEPVSIEPRRTTG